MSVDKNKPAVEEVDALVLFSGPGGTSSGNKLSGLVDKAVGFEWEINAVNTAREFGHTVEHGDLRDHRPRDMVKKYNLREDNKKLLFCGSPSCQSYSTAGSRKGASDQYLIYDALEELLKTKVDKRSIHKKTTELANEVRAKAVDDRSTLTFEVMRWIADLQPEYISLEQVPPVLPLWRKIGEVLEYWGYSVWTGNLMSEQFGVPQARRRALLIASRDGIVTAPVPTHSKYYPTNPARLDPDVKKWVSMADAIGWGYVSRPSYTILASGGNGTWGGKTVREKMWSDIAKKDSSLWIPNPRAVAGKRYTDISLTPEEAGILQSFPTDYPWQGTLERKFQQSGNAVPPLLQKAITEHILTNCS